VPWRTFLGYFLGLGTWGFGGPIASVGYMQRDLVQRRAWISRKDFLDGVALGQTMPGPLAAQVVMWLGFLRAGTLGALARRCCGSRRRRRSVPGRCCPGCAGPESGLGLLGGRGRLGGVVPRWPARRR
jgi:chromate transporter